jgi:hypothetical protein
MDEMGDMLRRWRESDGGRLEALEDQVGEVMRAWCGCEPSFKPAKQGLGVEILRR